MSNVYTTNSTAPATNIGNPLVGQLEKSQKKRTVLKHGENSSLASVGMRYNSKVQARIPGQHKQDSTGG